MMGSGFGKTGLLAGTLAVGAVALSAACASESRDSSAVTWQQPLEVDRGDGHRGPWRMNESQFHFVDDPTVAISKQDNVGVAWTDQRQQDVFFQLYDAEGEPRLNEPVNVSRSGDVFSWLPRMIVAGDEAEQIYILWQEIIFSGGSHGGEILFAYSRDGGQTFSEPINLSNTDAGAGKGRLDRQFWHNGSLDLTKGPEGRLYAAWTEYEGRLWVSHSTNEGRDFSEPVHVAGDDRQPARAPSLAVNQEGIVHLAWTVGEDPAADIHITRSADQGKSFEPPQTAHQTPGHADAPKLAIDSDQTLHLVYGESADGPLQEYELHYTRLFEQAEDFDEPVAVVSPQNLDVQSVNFPHLALDGEDNLHVLWEMFPDRQDRSRELGYTRSEDGGNSFASPAFLPGSDEPEGSVNGSQQGLLMNKLAVSEAGTIAAVNSTFKEGRSSHVWMFRGKVD